MIKKVELNKFSINRELFGKVVAEALVASAKNEMKMIIFYDRENGDFDFANTLALSSQFLPIIEVDAAKSDIKLPLDNPTKLQEVLEQTSKDASNTIFEDMLPDLLERLAKH